MKTELRKGVPSIQSTPPTQTRWFRGGPIDAVDYRRLVSASVLISVGLAWQLNAQWRRGRDGSSEELSLV